MKKKNITDKFKGIIPTVALKLGERSANQACVWWYNQPKLPEGLKKSEDKK